MSHAPSPSRCRLLPVLLLLILILLSPNLSAQTRDGNFLLPGIEAAARSEGAPEQLDEVRWILGQWQVAITTYPADAEPVTQPASASITWMNRGHAFMQQLHAADFDGQGHELNLIGFVSFTPASSLWTLSEVDSHLEQVQLYSGELLPAETDEARRGLLLHTAGRPGGGPAMRYERVTLSPIDNSSFEVLFEQAPSASGDWTTVQRRQYSRVLPSTEFMRGDSRFGQPATGLPKEARQFDFLVGDWQALHNMTFPDGRTAQWQANSLAGFVLNGHGLAEYSWFDTDPNLPDAATTIIRIYNRAMRRWDSLYLSNRGNSPLYFGGREEGDQIVLHRYDITAADRLSNFVFHDIGKDHYLWYGESSTDRGEAWNKFWEIEMTRKSEDDSAP